MIRNSGSSSQDGGIGRNPSPPCTTKRRKTTNIKSINNQKGQKNQTSWNSNNQRIKQSNRTTGPLRRWTERNRSEAADCGGGAGFGEVAGCAGRADLMGTETQR